MFVMKLLLLFSISMATLDSVNGQIGTAQIIALLRDVNGTSANMSATLPQLAALLKNQADMHIVSNLLLENNTVAADKMASILPQIHSFLREKLEQQDQVIETQQDHNAASLSLLQDHQDTLDQIASTLTNTTTSDAQIAVTKTLTQIENTQTEMANAFNQMIKIQQDHNVASLGLLQSHQDTLDQISSSLTNTTISQAQITLTQTQMAATQTQMSKTLTQVATTQTQMADTFNQMVNLLQMQGLSVCTVLS